MISSLIITSVLVLLTINVAYYLMFSIASKFKRNDPIAVSTVQSKIAVLIPAYKEDGIIVDTAKNALIQDYPSSHFDIVVIADSLKSETLEQLYALPIKTLEVRFEQSTKSKALNQAMERIGDDYDLAVVLDADNVMARDVLKRMHYAYVSGYKAMQAHRTAKNSHGNMAILDAISEEINNSIFRQGHVNLGLSSALIGSGMAFDYSMFKAYMAKINAIGGFDKELEIRLLRDHVEITYLSEALVYDEKVSSAQVFEKQRTRWLAAQFRYAIKSLPNAFVELIRFGKINYFDKAFQFILFPRLILLGTLFLLAVAGLLVQFTHSDTFIGLAAIYVMTLLLAVPSRFLNKRLLKSVLHLPRVFVTMILAMAKFRQAKTNFLHTPHQIIQS